MTGPATTARRILLIDDNVDSCELFAELLASLGHTVETALDGHEGLRRLVSEAYDVAVIDIGLPGLDGHTVARRAREQLGERTPFLIAVTGYGEARHKAESREAGFSAHLVKPVDIATLVAAIGDAPRLGGGAPAR